MIRGRDGGAAVPAAPGRLEACPTTCGSDGLEARPTNNFQQAAAENGLGGFRVGQFDAFVKHCAGAEVLYAAELHAQAELGSQRSGFGLDAARRMP